jgi:YtcA-like protein
VRVSAIAKHDGWLRFATLGAASVAAAGCDPILNIQGSFFPAWLICMVAGVVLTAVGRQLIVKARLEPHLGPLLLIYPSLWVLMTLVVWLVFYRT